MSISATARIYRDRAEAFFRSAQLLGTEPLDAEYAPAVGLLAVHGGISMTDAVLVAFDDHRSKAEDHSVAAKQLERLCSAKRLDTGGVKHLRELVQNKTRFSYGADVVRESELKKAKLRMEQFFKWVYGTFPDLARNEEVSDAKPV